MDVVLVRWPAEADRRELLSTQTVPRLLLVDGDAHPPLAPDCFEDWIRVPASEADLQARIAALSVRAGRHETAFPHLDEDGVLRSGPYWVPLPPVEERLVSALLWRFGSVVSREVLAEAVWPGRDPGRNALNVHVLRLRRRIHPLGLTICTVRSRGYLLERSSA